MLLFADYPLSDIMPAFMLAAQMGQADGNV